jgi:hypothetical protein
MFPRSTVTDIVAHIVSAAWEPLAVAVMVYRDPAVGGATSTLTW